MKRIRNILHMVTTGCPEKFLPQQGGYYRIIPHTSAARQQAYALKQGSTHTGRPEKSVRYSAMKSAAIGMPTRPLQIVVSDRTMFSAGGRTWEWTLPPDNHEILKGSNKPYYACLEALMHLAGNIEEQKPRDGFPHRPGSCLLFKGFSPSPHTV